MLDSLPPSKGLVCADGVVYGVWCMVYSVRCTVYGVWCMVYGVWCMVYGVWCMVYGVWCMVHDLWCVIRGDKGRDVLNLNSRLIHHETNYHTIHHKHQITPIHR